MKQKLTLLFATIFIIFILSEISLSLFTKSDLDGNKSIGYVHLFPFKLPIKETDKKIQELQKHLLHDSLKINYKNSFTRKYFDVRLLPDTILGWTPNPYFKSKDGLYIYNKNGIRTPSLLTEYNKKNKLRLAIFGDSYSHGDEVPFQNTIGYYLQSKFDSSSLTVEVINFAVSGYGMDQSFLKWENIYNKYSPDIVIFGVQFENTKRNVNLLRPFYYFTTEIPYSKPRFVIYGNKLQLIKNPIKDVTKTVDIIEHFGSWDFVKFESFYQPNNYEGNIFYYSKTISFINSALYQIFNEIKYYLPNSESYQVTYKLITKFKSEVESKGGIFIPVHLPVKNDFDFLTSKFLDIFYSKKFIYDELFNALKLNMEFVETYTPLYNWTKEKTTDKLFMKRHYSPISNKIIAEQIFKSVLTRRKLIKE